MEEEEHCHNVKITYLQEEKQFINRTIHTKIWVIIEILITYYSTINYDFTLTEALSFLVKLSLDIVIPFLQSVFFQSQQAMILQRFFHCCNAEKKRWDWWGILWLLLSIIILFWKHLILKRCEMLNSSQTTFFSLNLIKTCYTSPQQHYPLDEKAKKLN